MQNIYFDLIVSDLIEMLETTINVLMLISLNDCLMIFGQDGFLLFVINENTSCCGGFYL